MAPFSLERNVLLSRRNVILVWGHITARLPFGLALAAAQELDAGRDDFRDVPLVPFLVVVLPAPDGALDEHGAALREVLADRLGLLAPHDHVMPLRPLLALSRF